MDYKNLGVSINEDVKISKSPSGLWILLELCPFSRPTPESRGKETEIFPHLGKGRVVLKNQKVHAAVLVYKAKHKEYTAKANLEQYNNDELLISHEDKALVEIIAIMRSENTVNVDVWLNSLHECASIRAKAEVMWEYGGVSFLLYMVQKALVPKAPAPIERKKLGVKTVRSLLGLMGITAHAGARGEEGAHTSTAPTPTEHTNTMVGEIIRSVIGLKHEAISAGALGGEGDERNPNGTKGTHVEAHVIPRLADIMESAHVNIKEKPQAEITGWRSHFWKTDRDVFSADVHILLATFAVKLANEVVSFGYHMEICTSKIIDHVQAFFTARADRAKLDEPREDRAGNDDPRQDQALLTQATVNLIHEVTLYPATREYFPRVSIENLANLLQDHKNGIPESSARFEQDIQVLSILINLAYDNKGATEVSEAGVIPRLSAFVERPETRIKSACLLATLAKTRSTHYRLIRHGTIDHLVKILISGTKESPEEQELVESIIHGMEFLLSNDEAREKLTGNDLFGALLDLAFGSNCRHKHPNALHLIIKLVDLEPDLRHHALGRKELIPELAFMLGDQDIKLSLTIIKLFAYCGSENVRDELTSEHVIEILARLVDENPKLAYEAANTLKALFDHDELQVKILKTALLPNLLYSVGLFGSRGDITPISIIKNFVLNESFKNELIHAGLVEALAKGPLNLDPGVKMSTEKLEGIEDAFDILTRIMSNKAVQQQIVEKDVIPSLSPLLVLPFEPKFLSDNPNTIIRVILMFKAALRMVMAACDCEEFFGHILTGEIERAIVHVYNNRHNIAVPRQLVEETMNKVETLKFEPPQDLLSP
ncbi:hypothetical protein BDV93DRAFT_607741 [Ceratobasidium sp. AG-I]|nr:hypothetical protein BDV93DRAFT_607741 [Ceratobasidium sp. AG-I]